MIRVSRGIVIVEDIAGIESKVVEVSCIEGVVSMGLQRMHCSLRGEDCYTLNPRIELPYMDFIGQIIQLRSLVTEWGFAN